MQLYYQKHLKRYVRNLRQGGNLAEVLLWNALKNNQLGYRFLRQRPIGKYIVDFCCHKLNLAIEVDGAASHNNKLGEDAIRQRNLEILGIKFMRFTGVEVRYNLNGVREAIRAEILRLAKIPRPSGTPFTKGGISPFPLRKEE